MEPKKMVIKPSVEGERDYHHLFTFLLILLASLLFGWDTWWLVNSTESKMLLSSSPSNSREKMEISLNQLHIQGIAGSTRESSLKADSARLLQNGEWYLQGVEVHLEGLKGLGEENADVMDASTTVYFKADRGWVDVSRGNLILDGNLQGKTNQGILVFASRLGYDAARSEILLTSVETRSPSAQNYANYMIFDTALERTRLVQYYEPQSELFKKVLGDLEYEK